MPLQALLRALLEFLSVFIWGLLGRRRLFEPRLLLADLKKSPIHELPPELLLLIADELTEVSAASLSLTCYTIYSHLGKQCLENLSKVEWSVKNVFLRRLERDLPRHVACPDCSVLHSFDFARKHQLSYRRASGASKPPLACWQEDLECDFQRGIIHEFSSIIFRMAMKAYRQGHETGPLLKLLTYETKTLAHHGFMEHRSVLTRIRDGTLLLREQKVFMVPSCQELPVPWSGGLWICLHIEFLTMRGLLLKGIQIPSSDDIEGYENTQGVIYCRYCYTEFRIDFKSYGQSGNAMFVTRWMDIGEGREWDDPKFTSRLRNPDFQPLYQTLPEVVYKRGSICTAFEQKHESTFRCESLLTKESKRELCTKSPWPWPEGFKFRDVDMQYSDTIRNGRMVDRWGR